MGGKAVSGHSRKQTAQLRPVGCQRCGRKIRDGQGRRIGGQLLCPRCVARSQDPERPAP
jgi:formylmethanofuran dehydrogenase subunit E